tara:strand:- start:421 stop:978 length:558 start_codon:yes stop_codon:yes gene_type:complete
MQIDNKLITITRDCDGVLIPAGEKIKLFKGTHVRITQALGGDYTLYVNGNLIKISGDDSDAIGIEPEIETETETNVSVEFTEINEKQIWEKLSNVYDPEIPVNIVDLGLIYDLYTEYIEGVGINIHIKMTLTAPGCGMGPMIAEDAKNKVLSIAGVTDVNVELVWEPQWNKDMMTEEAKLQLGML